MRLPFVSVGVWKGCVYRVFGSRNSSKPFLGHKVDWRCDIAFFGTGFAEKAELKESNGVDTEVEKGVSEGKRALWF